MRKIIIDKEHGPVTTLQQAIDLADEGTTIKICEGAHDAAVRITKPNIKIEPREKDKPVYLIGTEGPLITVELPPGETCILKKLILIHSSSGAGGGRRFKEQYGLGDNIHKANPKLIKDFEVQEQMDTIAYVASGGLIVR